jgi:hypothetical protein
MAEASHPSSSSSNATRSATNIWLIGPAEEKINGMKLPTNRQMLAVFFHQHKILGKTVRDSSRYAVREVVKMWSMARIPTTIEGSAIEKLEIMFNRWQKLKKNINRRTETQMANENAFGEELDKLFDIAHADAMKMIAIAADRIFCKTNKAHALVTWEALIQN